MCNGMFVSGLGLNQNTFFGICGPPHPAPGTPSPQKQLFGKKVKFTEGQIFSGPFLVHKLLGPDPTPHNSTSSTGPVRAPAQRRQPSPLFPSQTGGQGCVTGPSPPLQPLSRALASETLVRTPACTTNCGTCRSLSTAQVLKFSTSAIQALGTTSIELLQHWINTCPVSDIESKLLKVLQQVPLTPSGALDLTRHHITKYRIKPTDLFSNSCITKVLHAFSNEGKINLQVIPGPLHTFPFTLPTFTAVVPKAIRHLTSPLIRHQVRRTEKPSSLAPLPPRRHRVRRQSAERAAQC